MVVSFFKIFKIKQICILANPDAIIVRDFEKGAQITKRIAAGASLSEFKKRCRVDLAEVERRWMRWSRDMKLTDSARKAGQRYLQGQSIKLSALCEPHFYDFCDSDLDLKLRSKDLVPIEQVLPISRNHVRGFRTRRPICDFVESICGEYALFRQGMLDGQFLTMQQGQMKPFQLQIFKTGDGDNEFTLEGKGDETANTPAERWAGDVVGRLGLAYLVGYSQGYDQVLVMILSRVEKQNSLLVGCQFLQCQTQRNNKAVEVCISRPVSCAQKGAAGVTEEDKKIAQQWLIRQGEKTSNVVRSGVGWAMILNEEKNDFLREV